MASGKRYYWLKLHEDFFGDGAIEWLEDQKNGKDYVLFYLKLCLKALKTKGILVREVGNMLIPYDAEKLAEITRTDFDTVTVAMELLKNIGLVQILDSGEIYMTQLQEMVGSETTNAISMRRLREAKRLEKIASNNDVTLLDECYESVVPDIRPQTLDSIPLDIKDGEKKEETPAAPPPPLPSPKEEKPKKHKYGEYKNVLLTDEELDKLKSEFSDWETRIERLSSYMASTGKRYKSHYVTILNWARRDAETGYQGKKPQAPAQTFVPGTAEKMAIERLRREREQLKTAGNDPEIAARAENLKKQLGG